MISMTGYAYCASTGCGAFKECGEKAEKDFSITVEIKGCNSRYLDIFINLPPFLSMMETKIRDKISACCGRGKIEVFIRIREHNVPVNISINCAAAKAYYDAINNLANELNLEEKPGINTLLGMDGVIDIEKNRDEDLYWQEIEPLLDEALKSFCAEREREGSHTKKDILVNLDVIESGVTTITFLIPIIENNLKDNIRSRFTELLANQVDENRVLAETAALLLKYTISEEISRLKSHIAEFKTEAERNKRPGKKLDFLCQEINREINTIGSKSAMIEVSREVIKMKEALENIREQLRNVE